MPKTEYLELTVKVPFVLGYRYNIIIEPTGEDDGYPKGVQDAGGKPETPTYASADANSDNRVGFRKFPTARELPTVNEVDHHD
jgi:hypothetical protein